MTKLEKREINQGLDIKKTMWAYRQ